jgi:uncharacterized lipoprotein YddW (UPF0748 family)
MDEKFVMIVLRKVLLPLLICFIFVVGSHVPVSAHLNHRHNDRRFQRDHRAFYLPSRGDFFRSEAVPQIDVARMTCPASEVRALWVVRDSLTSPEKIANVVDTAKRFGFNTLFVQVRGRGDALYNSTLEPRSTELAKEPLSFDPLATVIADAHEQGIQVHAWLNTFYVWSSPTLPVSPIHVVNSHRDWLVRDASGNTPLTPSDATEGAFLSPANEQARQFIHDVFMEVVRNYDIDGIHFDYVRYPSEYYDYSPAALTGFSGYINQLFPDAPIKPNTTVDPLAYVHAYPDQWASWRRDQVTELVRSISVDTKAIKPWVVVSAAVFANAQDAYDSRGQDWKDWLKEGIIDVVIPMAYNNSSALVGSQLKDAEDTAHQYGRYCYAGIGSWHITPDSTIEKIKIARELGVKGVVLFSYGGVTNYGSSYDYIRKVSFSSFPKQAGVPTLPWVTPRMSQVSPFSQGSGE